MHSCLNTHTGFQKGFLHQNYCGAHLTSCSAVYDELLRLDCPTRIAGGPARRRSNLCPPTKKTRNPPILRRDLQYIRFGKSYKERRPHWNCFQGPRGTDDSAICCCTFSSRLPASACGLYIICKRFSGVASAAIESTAVAE